MPPKARQSQAPRGRRRFGDPPPYLLHAASGRGYCTFNGQRKYFGPYHDQTSRDAYERYRTDWRRANAPTFADASAGSPLRGLIAPYLAELQGGMADGEWKDTKRNLEAVADRFGEIAPDDFRVPQFKAIRDEWVRRGHLRKTIGQATGRVRRWFRWMVEHEHCKPETYGLLLAIQPLRKGKAPDGEPVKPVLMRDYCRTRRELQPVHVAMARVQLFGGPRPGEVCRMVGREIDRSGKVWIFRPAKADKKDGATVYYFGPRTQAVLAPWLRADLDEPLFQPREAQETRFAAMRAKRQTKVQPSQESRKKRRPKSGPGRRYAVNSYGKAIARAAARAGVPHWHAHQLRHSFGTRLRRQTDLVTTSILLAHDKPDTTLIYAEEDASRATAAAARFG